MTHTHDSVFICQIRDLLPSVVDGEKKPPVPPRPRPRQRPRTKPTMLSRGSSADELVSRGALDIISILSR
jgi:hypothetical protein